MSSETVIRIKGRPKVKTLVIAAVVSVVGMALMALTTALDWGDGSLILGVGMAGIGIGTVLVAQDTARKSSVTARLNDTGFLLMSSRTSYGLNWSDVRRVTMAENKVIIRDKDGQDASIIAPPGAGPEELEALASELVQRLDASRGYGSYNLGS